MCDFRVRTYDRLEISEEEAGATVEAMRFESWARAGVARVTATRFGMELSFGPFVGTLCLPSGRVIVVEELIEGTVEACVQLANPRSRIAPGSAGGLRIRPLASVANAYVDAVKLVIGAGARKEYREVVGASSRPRGKLLISPTVLQERSRGRFQSVVARRRVLSEDTPINRALLAGAVRATALLRGEAGIDAARSITRSLSGARLEQKPSFPHSADANVAQALKLAELLVMGLPAVPADYASREQLSHWINVDRLFEEAVLAVTAQTATGDRVVHGEAVRVPLLGSRSGDPAVLGKRAVPDIVLKGKAVRLLDAKYRRRGDAAAEGELYQLMAHADAFGAAAAALVAPAISRPVGAYFLGRLRSGCRIDVIVVDPRDAHGLRELIASWLKDTGDG